MQCRNPHSYQSVNNNKTVFQGRQTPLCCKYRHLVYRILEEYKDGYGQKNRSSTPYRVTTPPIDPVLPLNVKPRNLTLYLSAVVRNIHKFPTRKQTRKQVVFYLFTQLQVLIRASGSQGTRIALQMLQQAKAEAYSHCPIKCYLAALFMTG